MYIISLLHYFPLFYVHWYVPVINIILYKYIAQIGEIFLNGSLTEQACAKMCYDSKSNFLLISCSLLKYNNMSIIGFVYANRSRTYIYKHTTQKP